MFQWGKNTSEKKNKYFLFGIQNIKIYDFVSKLQTGKYVISHDSNLTNSHSIYAEPDVNLKQIGTLRHGTPVALSHDSIIETKSHIFLQLPQKNEFIVIFNKLTKRKYLFPAAVTYLF